VTVLQFAIRPLLAMIDEPGLKVAFVHSAFNLSAATPRPHPPPLALALP
jgi:hypothetical protein